MRDGSAVWQCKLISAENDENPIYQRPIKHIVRQKYLTIQPMRGYTAIQAYGEDLSSYLQGIAFPYNRWIGEVKLGDKWYLNHKEPSETDMKDESAYNANYVVDYIAPQQQGLRIIFKKI